MKFRQIFAAIVIVGTIWQAATAQPKKKLDLDAPPMEVVLAGSIMQSNLVLSDLMVFQPEMPMGPQDVLKSYEIAMSLVADKTSSDFAVIVQAQQANQITRERAEYLLQQRYQTAMMQYQVLSALHDVLQHDVDEAAQQANAALKVARSDTVLAVPLPGSPSAAR